MSITREYTMIIELSESGRTWCGYSPDVPGGGVYVTDDTAEATEERLHSAIACHIRGLIADGHEIPETTAIVRKVKIAA
jgi:predicted RNase H-like HicB family nuclease